MLISYFLGFFGAALAGGGSTSYKGYWEFSDSSPQYPCIVLAAQIDLYLTYTDSTGKEVDTVVHVLPSSTVDREHSSCATVLAVQDQSIPSQVLQINLDHYPGWNIRFAFSKDARLKAVDQFILYQVNVTADYPATNTLFTNAPDTVYDYVQEVDLMNPSDVADAVFAHLGHSLSCTSEQKFWINKDPKQGPLASFKLSYLQVEAYKVTSQANGKFDPNETCPRDQHATDIVPVIVGSCLAGLIVITLITYLIYRCQLPREVLELTNGRSWSMSEASVGDHDVAVISTRSIGMNND
ncbi:unnamed protein product [Cylicocyclus nassatus]|uniref:Uncharacterized protein n=1 Tax=Cylicocyclus nassatus TaxID=53992 RepID=A0AA36H2G2_CYLNA|nr:unnamed protein product [Cylicocyclus nassatus]